MDKNALRDTLLALENADLQAAREAYADYLSAAKPDRTEADDAEDHSLNVSDAELAEGLEAPLQAAEAAMARLQAIDFGPKDTVAPGAVIRLNGQRFVFAVATRPFQVEGLACMGVSTDAPLFLAAQGKSAGDSVQVGGARHRIESVE